MEVLLKRLLTILRVQALSSVALSSLFVGCIAREATEIQYTLREGEPLAFAFLPRDQIGDIDWVAALDERIIHPRESIAEEPVPLLATTPILDFQVRFSGGGAVPDVIFPHKPHQQILDCRNCHPGIFLMQAGQNPMTMKKIEEGQYCGRCHGKVAFPLSSCNRCHSGPKPK